jgi:hypothetical protein
MEWCSIDFWQNFLCLQLSTQSMSRCNNATHPEFGFSLSCPFAIDSHRGDVRNAKPSLCCNLIRPFLGLVGSELFDVVLF